MDELQELEKWQKNYLMPLDHVYEIFWSRIFDGANAPSKSNLVFLIGSPSQSDREKIYKALLNILMTDEYSDKIIISLIEDSIISEKIFETIIKKNRKAVDFANILSFFNLISNVETFFTNSHFFLRLAKNPFPFTVIIAGYYEQEMFFASLTILNKLGYKITSREETLENSLIIRSYTVSYPILNSKEV